MNENPNTMPPVERLARKLAAEQMRLTKDVDGLHLPDDLWQQKLPEARRLVQFIKDMVE